MPLLRKKRRGLMINVHLDPHQSFSVTLVSHFRNALQMTFRSLNPKLPFRIRSQTHTTIWELIMIVTVLVHRQSRVEVQREGGPYEVFREGFSYHFVDHADQFGVLVSSGSQAILIAVGVRTIREVGPLLVQDLVSTRRMLPRGMLLKVLFEVLEAGFRELADPTGFQFAWCFRYLGQVSLKGCSTIRLLRCPWHNIPAQEAAATEKLMLL